jgi:hypothetical protein
MNCLAPLLHRPSFERKVIQGDHLHDSSFGAVYLLVCAVGSQFSDDPRVFLEGTDSEHSVGWKYFQQVQMVTKTLLGPPCLEDLQVYCVSVSPLSPARFRSFAHEIAVVCPVPARDVRTASMLDDCRNWHPTCAGCRRTPTQSIQLEAVR